MNAVVVYESLWGNTAAVAQAIAEGLGAGARALSTDEATAEVVSGADLVVAGSPLLGFTLPTEDMRAGIGKNPVSPAPDLAHPSMRSWLDALPEGLAGRCCGFETRIWWSPGSAARQISAKLRAKGLASAGDDAKFVVTGRYGPLKDGELDRARAWGEQLAKATR